MSDPLPSYGEGVYDDDDAGGGDGDGAVSGGCNVDYRAADWGSAKMPLG